MQNQRTSKTIKISVRVPHGIYEQMKTLLNSETSSYKNMSDLMKDAFDRLVRKEYYYGSGKSVNDWVNDVYTYAKKKGWWDRERSDLEIAALIHSEVSEFVEEIRNMDKTQTLHGVRSLEDEGYKKRSTDGLLNLKPKGPAVELVDVIIRIMDYFGHRGWDMEKILKLKHAFNLTRPYRHNKKY